MSANQIGPGIVGRLEVYLPKNPTISDRLLYLLTINRMTGMQLAKKSGVQQATLWNYLYKERIPKLDIAAKLAKTLNVSLDWLAGLSDDMTIKENKEEYDDEHA